MRYWKRKLREDISSKIVLEWKSLCDESGEEEDDIKTK
jgi:hypothetical protein